VGSNPTVATMERELLDSFYRRINVVLNLVQAETNTGNKVDGLYELAKNLQGDLRGYWYLGKKPANESLS
jgi:hypothetical protein